MLLILLQLLKRFCLQLVRFLFLYTNVTTGSDADEVNDTADTAFHLPANTNGFPLAVYAANFPANQDAYKIRKKVASHKLWAVITQVLGHIQYSKKRLTQ